MKSYATQRHLTKIQILVFISVFFFQFLHHNFYVVLANGSLQI